MRELLRAWCYRADKLKTGKDSFILKNHKRQKATAKFCNKFMTMRQFYNKVFRILAILTIC